MYYLDNAATTQPTKEVIDTVTDVLANHWGNPSSLYDKGEDAKKILDRARNIVSDFLSCKSEEIYFTSGACEANTMAIIGYLIAHPNTYFITSAIEHKSIMNIGKELQSKVLCNAPFSLASGVSFVKCTSEGKIDESSLKQACDASEGHDILVSIQTANNEIGTIQSIKMITDVLNEYRRDRNVVFHTDATQLIADERIDLSVWKEIDMLSFSGQKIHAPKGVGVLFKRDNIKIEPIIYGSQERGLRGGTENVPYIAGLARAIKDIKYVEKIKQNYFIDNLLFKFPCHIVGSRENRLKNNISLCIDGVNAEQLMYILSERGIYTSTGSACNKNEPSYVLKATGMNQEEIESTLRITVSPELTYEDIDSIVNTMKNVVELIKR